VAFCMDNELSGVVLAWQLRATSSIGSNTSTNQAMLSARRPSRSDKIKPIRCRRAISGT
jgi:hypothetical protein